MLLLFQLTNLVNLTDFFLREESYTDRYFYTFVSWNHIQFRNNSITVFYFICYGSTIYYLSEYIFDSR